jgi:hypothetical protein
MDAVSMSHHHVSEPAHVSLDSQLPTVSLGSHDAERVRIRAFNGHLTKDSRRSRTNTTL